MTKPSQNPSESIPSFPWDPNTPEESVEGLHRQFVIFAKQKIDWYHNEAEKDRTPARWIRNLVVCLATIGTLCPLLEATELGVYKLAAWGYVFFALAAGAFSFDRFHGLSTSWRRNTEAWLSIRSALIDFEHCWIIDGTDTKGRLTLLRQFWKKILGTVAEETAVWSEEDKQAIKALWDQIK